MSTRSRSHGLKVRPRPLPCARRRQTVLVPAGKMQASTRPQRDMHSAASTLLLSSKVLACLSRRPVPSELLNRSPYAAMRLPDRRLHRRIACCAGGVLHLDLAAASGAAPESLADDRLISTMLNTAARDVAAGAATPTYVVVSNDTDFLPTLNRLRRRGVRVVMAGHASTRSRDVAREGIEFVTLAPPVAMGASECATLTPHVASNAFDCGPGLGVEALSTRELQGLARTAGARACAKLAGLMARCSSPTFQGLQTELPRFCPDLVPERNRRGVRANLPRGSWKRFVLSGLDGATGWRDGDLRRVVELMRNKEAALGVQGLDRERLCCELGLLIRVRCTLAMVSRAAAASRMVLVVVPLLVAASPALELCGGSHKNNALLRDTRHAHQLAQCRIGTSKLVLNTR
jgi:NYN domain